MLEPGLSKGNDAAERAPGLFEWILSWLRITARISSAEALEMAEIVAVSKRTFGLSNIVVTGRFTPSARFI